MARKAVDLTGQKFGKLVVIERAGKDEWGKIAWRCRCQCGGERTAAGTDLTGGKIMSCGCLREFHGIDLTGQKFGKLVVIERAGKDNCGKIAWRCRCQCGGERTAAGTDLTGGKVMSCGCLRKLHGMTGDRLYNEWHGIKNRCNNPRNQSFKDYGGRGITICVEWDDSFSAFRDWALANGYRDDLTIERKDNDGPYCPENCRWTTRKEQQNNRRNNHTLTYNGKTQTIAQWAEELKISYSTLQKRISKYGWSEERTLETPVKQRKNK